MGKGDAGCSTTELLPRLVEQIGFEPMTDNPMSSAHQSVCARPSEAADKKATVEFARCAGVTPPPHARRGGIEPPLPGPREPTIYGPLKSKAQSSTRHHNALKTALWSSK